MKSKRPGEQPLLLKYFLSSPTASNLHKHLLAATFTIMLSTVHILARLQLYKLGHESISSRLDAKSSFATAVARVIFEPTTSRCFPTKHKTAMPAGGAHFCKRPYQHKWPCLLICELQSCSEDPTIDFGPRSGPIDGYKIPHF